MPHLFPDFRSGGAFVRQRIRGIAKLIHIKGARDFLGQSRGHILVIFGMPTSHIRARDPHLGTEGLYVRDFFLRHFVRNHQQDAITFGTRHERETQTGVPCRGFNDRAAWLQMSFGLGRLDHR